MQDLITRLQAKTDDIYEKVESMDKHLSNIDVNLAVYNERLQEHMRRTEIVEGLYKDMDKRVRPLENTQEVEKIIKRSIYKTFTIFTALIGASIGIYKIILLLLSAG